jgi:outer membrane protein assembly factor BamB
MKFMTSVLLIALIVLAACSGNEEPAKLTGERISILELQKSLSADQSETETALQVPSSWNNQYWPQIGGYPNHSMQHLSLGTDLKPLWNVNIGKGSSDKIPLTTQPVIVEGVIYTLDTRSEVRAFDTQGEMIWKAYTGPENKDDSVIPGGLAYSNNRIFVTNGHNELIALDHKTGDVAWRKKIPSASQAAPTILDSRVYVMTVDNRLLALAEADGTLLWDYTGLSEGTGLIGSASPAANSEIVVPVFSSGEVSALRVENGAVTWSESLGSLQNFGGLASLSDIKALPVIDQGLLITMNFSGRIAAIDIRTGTRIWEREIGGSDTPWVAGDAIFVLSSDNHLIALNRKNGLIHWVKKLPTFENPEKLKDAIQWQGPVLAGGRLIMIGSHGVVMEAAPETGEIIREWETKFETSIPPVIAGNILYILAKNGTLYAYQ